MITPRDTRTDVDVTERNLAEEEALAAGEAVIQANLRLRQLSADLLRSQDYERRRIAKELHDGTAQLLAALNMSLCHLRDGELTPDQRGRTARRSHRLGRSKRAGDARALLPAASAAAGRTGLGRGPGELRGGLPPARRHRD